MKEKMLIDVFKSFKVALIKLTVNICRLTAIINQMPMWTRRYKITKTTTFIYFNKAQHLRGKKCKVEKEKKERYNTVKLQK